MKKNNDQSTSSILWVVGDEEVQRYVFEQYSFGYWSACFDLILEKRGLISFDRADQSILARPEDISMYGMLIVSWLPEVFWRHPYIRTILSFDGPVFLEGPLPTELSHILGLESTGRQMREGFLSLAENRELEQLKAGLSVPLQEIENNRIPIGPKKVYTLPSELSRQELCVGPEHTRRIRLHDILLSHLLAYKQRFDRFGFFYKNAKIDLLAWIAWLEALDKMTPGGHRERCCNWLGERVTSLPDAQELEGDVQTLSMLGTVYAKVKKILGHDMYQKVGQIFELLYSWVEEERKPPTAALAWILCFLSANALEVEKRQAADKTARNLVLRLKDSGQPLSVEVLWTATLATNSGNVNNHTFLAKTLFKIVVSLGRKPKTILSKLEQRPLWEVILLSGVLVTCGMKELGGLLLDLCMRIAFDPQEGFFQSAVVKTGDFEIRQGFQSIPWIALGLLPHVERIQLRDQKRQLYNYSARQKRVWKAQPWRAENYSGYDGEVLATLRHDSEEGPVLLRKGNLTVSAFQILSFLVHYHTMHPLDDSFCDCPSFHVHFIESMLIKTLLHMISQAGVCMPLVAPWPFGYRYCMTIRHDVDRLPDEETFSRLLEFETEKGLGASWFWIPSRTNSRYMARIGERGLENGLHAMHLARKYDEIATVESSLPSGMKVYGENHHGGGGGDYWRGPSSVLAAIEAALHYSELSSNFPIFPSTGFPMMKKNGTIYLSRIVGLTHLCSVDRGLRRRTMNLIDFKCIREMAKNGYYVMILNHPDINFDALCRCVENTPQKGRLDWTCAKVARWWRATHDRSSVELGGSKKRRGKLILNPNFKYDTEERVCLRVLIGGASCTLVQAMNDGRQMDTSWRYSTVEGLPCIDIGFIPQKEQVTQVEIHFG